VRRCEMISIPEGKRGKGQLRKSLEEVIRENLKVVGLTEDRLRIGSFGGIG